MIREDRAKYQVRIVTERDRIVRACGFICGERQVLTCTHVVASAAGKRAKSGDTVVYGDITGVSVSARFTRTIDSEVRLKVVRWHPVHSLGLNADVAEFHDLCLLELEDGFTFPPGFKIANILEKVPEAATEVMGAGLTEDYEAIDFRGRIGEYKQDARLMVSSPDPEHSIRPGCSGMAIATLDGVVAMAAASQAKFTGFTVPCHLLRRFLQLPAGGPSSSLLSPPPALTWTPTRTPTPPPPPLLNDLLSTRLDLCNRHDQSEQFRQGVDIRWKDTNKAFVCTIAGAEPDMPSRCKDKFYKYDLAEFLRYGNMSTDLPAPRQVDWPSQRVFDVNERFLRLSRRFARDLKPEDPNIDPEKIRESLNALPFPFLSYAIVEERYWSEAQKDLVQKWIKFIASIGNADLKLPMIHFFVIILNGDDTRPDDLDQMTEAYVRILDQIRGEANLPAFLAIDVLKGFRYEDVDEWIDEVARVHGDLAKAGHLKLMAQNQLFETQSRVRLKQLQAWLGTLG